MAFDAFVCPTLLDVVEARPSTIIMPRGSEGGRWLGLGWWDCETPDWWSRNRLPRSSGVDGRPCPAATPCWTVSWLVQGISPSAMKAVLHETSQACMHAHCPMHDLHFASYPSSTNYRPCVRGHYRNYSTLHRLVTLSLFQSTTPISHSHLYLYMYRLTLASTRQLSRLSTATARTIRTVTTMSDFKQAPHKLLV